MLRAYAGLVTFNLEVAEIARAYNHDLGIMERIGMLVTANTDSSELRICVRQIFNTKIHAFCGIFPVHAQGVGNFDVFETLRILLRNKRYIFTEGLAAVTGLVASSTVDDIKTNQKELGKGEETNSVQIVMLEKETNLMLGNLRNQSERMKSLYSYESELQERLSELM